MLSIHDQTAIRIARREGVEYNRGPGPDIVTPRRVIEVETRDTVRDAFRQLSGYQVPVYIAGADQAATTKAVEETEGTTVGVMDPYGEIVKPSTRGR